MSKSAAVKIADDMVVAVHFKVHNEAGEVVDETGDTPHPYLHGADNMPPALEAAFTGHTVGDKFEVTLSPEEGYGERDERGVQTLDRSDFPDDFDVPVGASFLAEVAEGEVVEMHILELSGDKVVIDTNHPLAGFTLTFKVEIVGVRPATKDELAHGHPHGLDGSAGHHH